MHTLLVVDDQPENLQVLADLLCERYRVLVALNGRRALQLAASQPRPDLILLDINMPEMDGFEVLQRLREDPLTRHVPVLFLTARDAHSDEQRGLELGAVDYVTKPVMPASLLARVATHLELKAARDRLADRNLELEALVAERMRDNEAIQDVAIQALARLAETRDPETGNHILRTQAYVRLLAECAARLPAHADALPPATIDLIAKSAPLHDIGKVGVPDAILLKPGKLDDAEWTVMRRHAVMGAQAIARAEADVPRALPFLRYAREIAHWHHERWDGSGYPDGLAGTAIPLSARLMAVADVFDALISRRVYKAPFTPQQARSMIAAERGRHFDPALVDLFLAHFDEFVALAERWPDDEASVAQPYQRLAQAA